MMKLYNNDFYLFIKSVIYLPKTINELHKMAPEDTEY